ncbi:DNA-binding protein [Clostridium sp. CX1]|uniref:DNA-binding protein n=1 Tax=Clostridium tanneri TaxID=3037988 RepID=A0ABU4JVD8_9CLOT|nr:MULTISPECIES: PPC domain-containing DNA-binding protein [unclassified Clostridium]MCT8975250.1 DNA-binding protein [Clostridium sp. CX1]MDW8802112.1 DNA-binding protein [Clostridium sp. A1-XYC3]
MICKKLGSNWVIRIDKGEEIVSNIKEICEKNNIKAGFISAIGAADKVKIGLFNTNTKVYHSETLSGDFEITNLTGNVSRKDGEVYIHLHITVSDEEYKAYGGHLNEAWISGTCEMLLTEVDGEIGRQFDDNSGLNIFELK